MLAGVVRIMKKTAFIFPGQGAQYVAMAREIYDNYSFAREMFATAADIIGFDIGKLIFEGPEETLAQTENAQPAIFLASSVCLKALREEAGDLKADYMAGLSLGEYTAYYAAGSISFEDGLRLVRKRGEYMELAGKLRKGTMVTILGLDEAAVRKICGAVSETGTVQVANLNCPGQVVISGEVDATRLAAEKATEAGARRAIELKVSGAFHSELMLGAKEKLEQELAGTEICAPKVPVIANASAGFVTGPDDIRCSLAAQLTSSVLWQKSMEKLIEEGVGLFVEIGCGKVLRGILRKIDRQAQTVGVEDMQSLNETVEKIGQMACN
jgi:[acyl-carrier-protein] S-malonyltransferase